MSVLIRGWPKCLHIKKMYSCRNIQSVKMYYFAGVIFYIIPVIWLRQAFYCLNITSGFWFKYYFICIWQVYKATQNTITIQTLYKWDSEESQMTYLNLYPKCSHYWYTLYLLSCRNCHLCRRIMAALYSCLAIGIEVGFEGSTGSGM